MIGFDYADSPDPIRADLTAAHRAAWAHIASPGAWLTGAERVAVARETRSAHACALCASRKIALSPFAARETHASSAPLAAVLVDAIHRVSTDASRLTRKWYEGLAAQGMTAERYVEALVHRALGLAREPLPAPLRGDPTRARPAGLVAGIAWVPMIDPARAGASERDLFSSKGPLRSAYVMRALTLAPNEVRAWIALGSAQYLTPVGMTRQETGRALDRAQIEFVAGRVSALNACFY